MHCLQYSLDAMIARMPHGMHAGNTPPTWQLVLCNSGSQLPPTENQLISTGQPLPLQALKAAQAAPFRLPYTPVWYVHDVGEQRQQGQRKMGEWGRRKASAIPLAYRSHLGKAFVV